MAEGTEPSWGEAAIAHAAIELGSTVPTFQESRLVRWTRKVPIAGKLWDCRPEHVREAFYEVGCVLLFSTLPLWFFPLISYVLFTVELPFFAETVSSGELLIYAASLSGAMVYFIAKRYGTVENGLDTPGGPLLAVSVSFPYGRFFIILSALICMFAAATFFMIKTAKYLLSDRPEIINQNGTALTSWLLFLFSIIMFFCAVAFRNLLDDGRSYRNEPANEVIDKWDEQK